MCSVSFPFWNNLSACVPRDLLKPTSTGRGYRWRCTRACITRFSLINRSDATPRREKRENVESDDSRREFIIRRVAYCTGGEFSGDYKKFTNEASANRVSMQWKTWLRHGYRIFLSGCLCIIYGRDQVIILFFLLLSVTIKGELKRGEQSSVVLVSADLPRSSVARSLWSFGQASEWQSVCSL